MTGRFDQSNGGCSAGVRGRASPRSRAVGFSLVELLVTISIISLLLAILLPALSAAREKGKLVKCLGNMRGISQSSTNFLASNGRFQLVSDEVGVNTSDPDRSRYSYSADRELLAWPVALAKMDGIVSANWDWGVRATNFGEAKGKKGILDVKTSPGWNICPSDTVRIASAYYPRNKGGSNNGLVGSGDPADPHNSPGDSYWGYLSYGLNEDVVGAEVSESRDAPACWRRVEAGGSLYGCRGEFVYPPAHPCGGEDGRRLQGNMERVFQPTNVGLVFEAGRDFEDTSDAGFANLVTTALAAGPYLQDFQQFHQARMPNARHPRGALNILYADFHGGTVYPTKFNPVNRLPSMYSPQVRVSPHRP